MSSDSLCYPSSIDGNEALAFGLVTAAGLSTTLGACLAFLAPKDPSKAKLYLAVSLAVAAGVMIYVSFVEIFTTKAIGSFENCMADNYAYLYATLCFFGGVILTWLMDMALHKLEALSPKMFAGMKRMTRRIRMKNIMRKNKGVDDESISDAENSNAVHDPSPVDNENSEAVTKPESAAEGKNAGEKPSHSGSDDDDLELGCVSLTDPTGKASENIDLKSSQVDGEIRSDDMKIDGSEEEPVDIDEHIRNDGVMVAELYAEGIDSKQLLRMGIFAGIIFALHNFPEGLATYVSVKENPKVGASVAIAIAVHNIPEGIAVAMPIFYATGSRWKAVMWASLSGLTELVGAFFGWLILQEVFNQIVYGVLFGLIAGMMVTISLKELLPAAHRYDSEDKLTTISVMIGCVIMALSLVLFQF